MKDYARLASLLINTPVALREAKCEMLVAVLAERLGIARLDRMDGSAMTAVEMNEMAALGRAGEPARDRLYEVVEGVAIIPVDGILVHKAGWVGSFSGMTGYDGIALLFRQAMADTEVKAIWLDVDSPGGSVPGCFDLVDEIYASNRKNGGKPIWAMINEQATSAACALVTAADKVFIPRTGVTASMAVYVLFVDQTEALSKEGLKVEFIRSDPEKALGSGLEPLADSERTRLQAAVDADAELFRRTVARNRNIPLKSVADTKGAWLRADEALALGLVDGVMSEVEAFAKLQRSLKRAG